MRQALHSLVGFLSFLGLGLLGALIGTLLILIVTVGAVAVHAALLGALLGALSGGLSGPEVERRAAPNQGIWQSATNVGVFALVGGFTLGILWGLFNLVAATLMTGHVPQARDGWDIGLRGVLLLAVCSGLIPGAACIQHGILRLVLWCNGVIPWHYVRFLDFATERMFLQRVGGRYRFLHDLLRDRFAAMEPKQDNNGPLSPHAAHGDRVG
jgi:MFS family permease